MIANECNIWCLLFSWPLPSLYISIIIFAGLWIHLNNKINKRDRLRGYTKKQEREWKKLGTFEEELRRREK